MRKGLFPLLAAFLAALPLAADTIRIEFEPKVGVIGVKVIVRTPPPEGARLRFGKRLVPFFKEGPGLWSFLVPPASTTSFIEYVKEDRTVGKSAVPFVVSGTSLVQTPKLVGLKEAIDVFGYSDPRPEGGERPEPKARPVLKFDEQEILTIGEPSPQFMTPAVESGDLATAARGPLQGTGLLITARPPKKRLQLTLPPLVPTPLPESPPDNPN
jgi:hypothetical protein